MKLNYELTGDSGHQYFFFFFVFFLNVFFFLMSLLNLLVDCCNLHNCPTNTNNDLQNKSRYAYMASSCLVSLEFMNVLSCAITKHFKKNHISVEQYQMALYR